jgi:hypothetical protein
MFFASHIPLSNRVHITREQKWFVQSFFPKSDFLFLILDGVGFKNYCTFHIHYDCSWENLPSFQLSVGLILRLVEPFDHRGYTIQYSKLFSIKVMGSLVTIATTTKL